MMINRLTEDLRSQGYSIGSWLTLGSPAAAEVMAMAGFHWLVIDAEHSSIGLADIAHMVRAIESRGATPLVRVPDDNGTTIGRVLDTGAFGIVVPHVCTAEQAHHIARACRYPSRGTRGVGTSRAFSHGAAYHPGIDDLITVIAQIEDPQGIDNTESILATEGINMAVLGPKDLSFAMGVDQGSKVHEDAVQQFLAACRKVGKPVGIPVKSREEVIKRRAQGFQFFGLNNDFRLLEAAAVRELQPLDKRHP